MNINKEDIIIVHFDDTLEPEVRGELALKTT